MRIDDGGFSLIELVIGIAFFALFAAMVQSACTALRRGVRVLEVASEAQETTRLAVQLIVADAREAGFGQLPDRISRAGRTVLGIARDLNGDGDVDDPQERVTYSCAADRGALLRAQGDAAPQPLVDGLDADGLALTFIDAHGVALDPGSAELDPDQRRRIRRIGVRVRVALPSPDPSSRAPLRVEETATATLRNAGL